MLPVYQQFCQGNTAVLPEGFTAIEKEAFSDNLDLVRVVIPSTVTAIEDGAFRGCSNLKEVSIPESVLGIGNSAFCNCEKLSAIHLPKSLRYLGPFAFANSGLKSVTLATQDEDFQMERGAFRDCPSLAEVTVECKYIGEHAFTNCENLERVSFGEGLRGIGEYAFADCPKITIIKLQGNLRHLGDFAFANTGLKSVSLASQDEEFDMGKGVFQYCPNLVEAAVECRIIGESAFDNCLNLERVSFGESLRGIREYAFNECQKLSAIELPGKMRFLGSFAFANAGLKSVTLASQDEEFDMGKGVFQYCPNLVEAAVECRIIGESAFDNCLNLERVSFGESLRGIREYAFNECQKLSAIELPGKMRFLGSFAFANAGLKSVSLASQDEEFNMGKGVFQYCSNLTQVNIDTKYVGQDAFAGCTKLQAVFVRPTTPPRGSQAMFDDSKAFILVPMESVEAYQEAEYWREYAHRIQAIPDPRLD